MQKKKEKVMELVMMNEKKQIEKRFKLILALIIYLALSIKKELINTEVLILYIIIHFQMQLCINIDF